MDDLQLAIEAAQKAGSIIKDGFSKTYHVSEKPNKGFVTEIDVASESAILEVLGSSHPILAEETASKLSNEDVFWAIDPLDGTTNFIRGLPYFAVSIALMKHGKPIIGVVYNPLTQELFSAKKNSGAFLNGDKIHVSQDNQLIIVNSGYDQKHKEAYAENIKKIVAHHNIRHLGSSAYELATVARGALDGFVCWGDELWDHAAGILLVQEAGGIVTDWENNEWSKETSYVLAGNKTSHAQLFSLMKNS